jgi:uncharacterized protein (DUF2062 family)
MHGLLRHLLLHTKPWQRAVLGVVLIAVGWFAGAIMLPVIGGVLVFGTVYGAVRSQQARREQLRRSPMQSTVPRTP